MNKIIRSLALAFVVLTGLFNNAYGQTTTILSTNQVAGTFWKGGYMRCTTLSPRIFRYPEPHSGVIAWHHTYVESPVASMQFDHEYFQWELKKTTKYNTVFDVYEWVLTPVHPYFGTALSTPNVITVFPFYQESRRALYLWVQAGNATITMDNVGTVFAGAGFLTQWAPGTEIYQTGTLYVGTPQFGNAGTIQLQPMVMCPPKAPPTQ